MLDKAAVMQKNYILRKPSRLAYVVGYNNYFDAAVLGINEDALDGERRGGIEACGRLIEKQHFWIEAKSSSEAEPLLLAAGEDPCRCECMALQSSQLQSLQCALCAFAPGKTPKAKCVGDVGCGGPAEQHGFLEHHGLATPDLVIHWCVAPKNDTLGGLD